MFNRILYAGLIVVAMALLPLNAAADSTKNGGLTISPVRQELSVAAGKAVSGSLLVSNFSDNPLAVNLSTKQFTVTDHTYNYEFQPVIYDWMTIQDPRITLQPSQSTTVHFTMTVPADAAGGGYYFALFATAQMTAVSTAQVASLVYAQVDGAGIVRSGSVQNGYAPPVVFFGDIPFRFEIKNSGNVHFNAQLITRLEGVFGSYAVPDSTHIVLPNTVRDEKGSLASPVLPGIYRLVYGYKADDAKDATTKTIYILYIPPWSIVAVGLLLLIVLWLWQYRGRLGRKKA